MTAAWTLVGSVGGAGWTGVDPRGALVAPQWSLDWWIGGDDRWHAPATDSGVRQSLAAPGVVETRVKVPGGDAVQRVYGVGGPGDLVVVEVENDSPAPFALALRPQGRAQLFFPREPFDDIRDADGPPQGSRYTPVAHRATIRLAAASTPGARTVDTSALPDAESVTRAWRAHLAHGMRVETCDERFDLAVRAVCAGLLLFDDGTVVRSAPFGTVEADPAADLAVLVALEEWGLGGHAAELWPSIRRRDRRRRPRGPAPADALDTVHSMLEAASPTYTWPRDAEGHHGGPSARFLLAAREMFVTGGPEAVAVLPALPPSWRGAPIEVHDAPLGEGTLSFALRWHGDKPALMWDARSVNPRITAPALAPGWSSADPTGEELLTP